MAFWDLVSYGLTLQLFFTVWTHVRRILRVSYAITVILCYSLSIFCHLLHLSLSSFIATLNNHNNVADDGDERIEIVFPLNPLSVSLLALTFLLLIYIVEAATWFKVSFVPLLKSVKVFYHKLPSNTNPPQSIHQIQAVTFVTPPGIDLRGKALSSVS
jgi:hypothetical protein